MNFKILLIAVLSLFFVACGIDKRKQAEQIINEFQQKNIPDKREAVFNIYPNFKNGNLILKGETDNLSTKDELLNALKSFNFTDEINVLPDSTIGGNNFGLINLSVANLRASPNHSSEMVTQALLGTPVKILKKENTWYLVQTPDDYISWIDASGIFTVSEIRLNNWRKAKRIIFNQDFSLVYESEKLENPISDVTLGSILE
ncbi:MAG: SH3 domain-containing protein, partial [Prolixibacteraceae bacterium]|nr:SH3 domain-containing protein [Prolixibacteraceae bacterium]